MAEVTIPGKSAAAATDLGTDDKAMVHRLGQAVAQYVTLGDLALYLRVPTFAGGLSGAGTTQGAATALTANTNIATTVTGTNNAFRMPAGTSLLAFVLLFNDDAADALQIFPASGENIGAGTDLPYMVGPGDWVRFEKKTVNSWYFAAGTVSV